MSGNAGFLFYKEFYTKYNNNDWKEIITKKKSSEIELDETTKKHINNTNDLILGLKIDSGSRYFYTAAVPLKLTTTYPGLVLGTGYHHETGVEGEFKIGFYFDYTTGLPVIPGSSVKGLLRSAFPNRGNKKLTDEYKNQRTEYLREIFEELKFKNFESIDFDKLELEVFRGIKNKNAKKASDKYLPMYKRDIFHDAFPVKVSSDGLFRDDFITPHGDNPLKNPIPLKFLKVSPGVTFQFNFDLKDSETTAVKKEEKLKLFLKILFDMGIGAKTNVGYGQFDDSDEKKLISNIDKQVAQQKEQEKLASMTDSERKEAEKQKFIEEINNYQGKPSDLFKKWLNIESLKEDPEVAKAFIKVATLKLNNKWSKQAKYISRLLNIKNEQLEEMRNN